MFSSIPPQKFRLHMLYNDGGEAVRLKIWFPKQQRLDVYVNGIHRSPNNQDFSKDDYSLSPPDPSIHVPALTEGNGFNFFDPASGHLYVIVKGPDVIDVKTQPIVVLKLGMTVPIENFFEENVIGNLAGLLGIDPKNIRVTNIVREGSVPGKRKKRSEEGAVTGLEFEIAPPPTDTVGDFVPPPEKTTTAAPAPGVSTTTENPAYTTTEGDTTTTTEYVKPEGHLDYGDLALVTASISTKFQTGSLGAEMGLDIGELDVEKAQPPPPAPPPLPPPELRSSTEGVPFAEQSLANDTALLEDIESKTLVVPSDLKIARQPENVEEMRTVTVRPGVYVTDSQGRAITVLGDAADPWICTLSVKSGPGGDAVGNLSAPFIDGVALFGEFTIDEAGSDYVLEFSVTYPADTVLTPVESIPFNVASRPLGLRFEDEPPLRKENTTFEVVAMIWDDALDEMASSSVLSSYTWDCSISLRSGDSNLTGTTDITLSAGTNKAVFSDLALETAGVNYDLKVDCYSTEASKTVMAVSLPFHVHDYPETGLLRKTSTGFKFTGLFSQVESLVDAYNQGLISALTCEGCPPGALVSGRSRALPALAPGTGQGQQLLEGEWQRCGYPAFMETGQDCPAAEEGNEEVEEVEAVEEDVE